MANAPTLSERTFDLIMEGWIHNHTGMKIATRHDYSDAHRAKKRKRKAAKAARRANR